MRTVEGPVGPGRALQQALNDRGTVVATVICGDDYVAERDDDAGPDMAAAIEKYPPDLVLAGPAFDAPELVALVSTGDDSAPGPFPPVERVHRSGRGRGLVLRGTGASLRQIRHQPSERRLVFLEALLRGLLSGSPLRASAIYGDEFVTCFRH